MSNPDDYDRVNQTELQEPSEAIFRPEYTLNELAMREVPPEMRTCHIVYGYRPVGRSVCFYLRGLFSWHNETLPIWSHLVALFAWGILFAQWHGSAPPAGVVLVLGNGARLWMTLHHLCLGAVFFVSTAFHLFNSIQPYVRYCTELLDVGTVLAVGFLCTSQMIFLLSWPVLLRRMLGGACWTLSAVTVLRGVWLCRDQDQFKAYCDSVAAGQKAVALRQLGWVLSPFVAIAAVIACYSLIENQGLLEAGLPNLMAVISLGIYWAQWPDNAEWFQKLTNSSVQGSHFIFHIGVAIWAFGCMKNCS